MLISWKHTYNFSYFLLYPVTPVFILLGRTGSRDLACSQTPALLRQQAGCASLPARLDKAGTGLVNWLKMTQPEPNLTILPAMSCLWAKWSTVESYITMPSESTDDGPRIAFQNPPEEEAPPRTTQSKLRLRVCSHVSTTS